jgi:catechol 2,3-dioxygenase
MNTWRSAGAGGRRATLGLGLVRIELPASDDLGALGERLGHFQVPVADDGRTVRFEDPWANRIEVSVAAS